jgi:hypothetical protein
MIRGNFYSGEIAFGPASVSQIFAIRIPPQAKTNNWFSDPAISQIHYQQSSK